MLSNLESENDTLKKEIRLRDNQIETMKKSIELNNKDLTKLNEKIKEISTYNEDLKKFQLDKEFHISELNTKLDSKDKVMNKNINIYINKNLKEKLKRKKLKKI
jgi:hypothetical protein